MMGVLGFVEGSVFGALVEDEGRIVEAFRMGSVEVAEEVVVVGRMEEVEFWG